MSVTIYHNPKCGTSRKVLGFLREKGIELNIVEYLKDPPSKAKLQELLAQMGLKPRELLRKREAHLCGPRPRRRETHRCGADLRHGRASDPDRAAHRRERQNRRTLPPTRAGVRGDREV